MAFVNEYIPAEDIEKYGIKEIDKKFIVGGTNARDWTIDRERAIYLRNVANGREEFSHISEWTFYWHGELLWLEIHHVGFKGERGGPCWSRELLHSMQSFNSHDLAPHLQPKMEEILADLKEALLAYKDGGVFATCTEYSLTLEIAAPGNRAQGLIGNAGLAMDGRRNEQLHQEERNMAFINEYIPAQDIEKYGIKEIDKKFFVGGTNSRQWTVDRERGMYLRCVSRGREEISHISGWTFYWHGELLWLEIHMVRSSGERGGPCWSQKRLHRLQSFNSHDLAPHLQPKREEILADLKEALLAYKDGGIFATCTEYSLTLEIE